MERATKRLGRLVRAWRIASRSTTEWRGQSEIIIFDADAV